MKDEIIALLSGLSEYELRRIYIFILHFLGRH
nr:MAG TPA: hypothetical protein [Caudoviricetes sp.]